MSEGIIRVDQIWQSEILVGINVYYQDLTFLLRVMPALPFLLYHLSCVGRAQLCHVVVVENRCVFRLPTAGTGPGRYFFCRRCVSGNAFYSD